VRGLNESIDAWLTKPVDIGVLAATLNSVARRVPPGSVETVADAGRFHWRLARGGWSLRSAGHREIALNFLERAFLTCLMDAAGEVVSHDTLIGALGAVSESFDLHRLEMLIHRLRRKVLRGLRAPLPLRSVRGQGYVLLVDGDSGKNR
jgi:DNA-binding response OmpR family regulator